MGLPKDKMKPIQFNKPLFVKRPFKSQGKFLKKGEEFIWLTKNINEDKVESLYELDFIYHNEALEKENHSGDRLLEMNLKQLRSLKEQLNHIVKKRTQSKEEYNKKSCKTSTLPDKQVALIRRFLSVTPWIEEDFYEIRDRILKVDTNDLELQSEQLEQDNGDGESPRS